MNTAFVDCALVVPGSLPERVNKQDYVFTEGPTNDRKGKIYFCDNQANLILCYDTRTAECSTWASDTQGSNGACFLRNDQLVSCRGLACDVVRWTKHGKVDQVLASTFNGMPFNAPNDVVISRSGWIFFTDPDFDNRANQPEGVYSLSPTGELERFETGILRPNGILLSPDESMLIVNGTKQQDLIAWDLATNGVLRNRRVFASVREPNREAYLGYPLRDWFGCDGMAVNVDGDVFVTCGAGVEVFDRTGSSVGIIVTPEKPTNVCFGEDDAQTLFITAQRSLYAVRCTVPGVVFQQPL